MSWICPHDNNGDCTRRKAPCQPGRTGCVMEGRITPPPWDETSTQTGPESETSAAPDKRSLTIGAMKEVFGNDTRRIRHALAVLDFAEQILGAEGGSREVVVAAAILHDIGIRRAEAKHGSAAGRFQEIEGPPIARDMMERLGYDKGVVEHVCRIIANHHSGRNIDTLEFRILWDADWLVNIPEEFPEASSDELEGVIVRIFKTDAGRRMARCRYLDPHGNGARQ